MKRLTFTLLIFTRFYLVTWSLSCAYIYASSSKQNSNFVNYAPHNMVSSCFFCFFWRDVLLLEIGFLTILVAPLNFFGFHDTVLHHAYDRIPFWLVRWLLFRLTFSSGVAKLTGDDRASWWSLSGIRPTWWLNQLLFNNLFTVADNTSGYTVIECYSNQGGGLESLMFSYLYFSPNKKVPTLSCHGDLRAVCSSWYYVTRPDC